MNRRFIARGRRVPGEMNKLESRYAQQLEARKIAGEIAEWHYEVATFKLAHDMRYTPDFMVMLPDGEIEFVETKGWMREDAFLKIKMAARLLPFRFIVAKHDKNGWNFTEIKP